MGPIKIKIATTQIEGASEYDAPKASEYDAPKEAAKPLSASEYDSPRTAPEAVKVDKSGDGDSCYSYEGTDCVYTEPASGTKYTWDTVKAAWVDKETGEARAAGPVQQQAAGPSYKHDGEGYYYVDRLTMMKHRWDNETSAWKEAGTVEEEEGEESEEDESMTEEERKARQYRKRKVAPWFQAQTERKIVKDPVTGVSTYTDTQDGVVYELDPVKNAWFPKIDEEFMANYQINYGFTPDGVAEPTKPSEDEPKVAKEINPGPEKKKKKTEAEEAAWFEEEEARSTKVYVSNLPSNISEESFVELMSKCGMVEYDVRNKKPKVKVYRDEEGKPKGDGLCSYIKPESVQLALTIIDGSEYEGMTLAVTRAKFEMKGEYDAKLKPKKLTKKQLEKAKKSKERLFEWQPDKLKGERAKHEKVIVIKNMFTVEELDTDPGLILDFTNNIRTQCAKFGTVAKVSLYDKHPEGVCQVSFREPIEADMAVSMLHGRMFGKKVMEVTTWDGRTKYKKEESKEDEEKRLAEWDKYLKDGDEKEEEGKEEKEKGKDEEVEEKEESMEEDTT